MSMPRCQPRAKGSAAREWKRFTTGPRVGQCQLAASAAGARTARPAATSAARWTARLTRSPQCVTRAESGRNGEERGDDDQQRRRDDELDEEKAEHRPNL